MASRSVIGKLAQLRSGLNTRSLRIVAPDVLTVDEVSDRGDAAAVVPPRGSIVIYYESQGEKFVDSIRAALPENNSRMLQAVGRRARQQVSARPQPSEAQVLAALPSVPCLFDVRYGGKTVADHVGLLPGQTFGTVTLAYVGGRLNDRDFKIAEYHTSENSPGYRYLIVKREPILTDLERAVLNRIPQEQIEITIGNPIAEDTFKEVADVVKKMVEDAKREKEAKKGFPFDLLDKVTVELQAGNVSPTAAVQHLMKARHELIQRSFGRG